MCLTSDGIQTLGEDAAEHGAVAHSQSATRHHPFAVLDEEDPILAKLKLPPVF